MASQILVSTGSLAQRRQTVCEVSTSTRCLNSQHVFGLRVTHQRRSQVIRTAEEKVIEAAAPASVSGVPVVDDDVEWIPVLAPEDLPKGVRKEVKVAGKTLLIFWYRNQIYCTEARSPAEGAYSEGLIKGKFTQDYAIECPTTGTLYSLKDGSIIDWYPTNAVLRAITPRSRALELYPVKLSQDGIYISPEAGTQGGIGARSSKGGADSSAEANNVFGVEPKVYVAKDEENLLGTVVTGLVTLLAVGALGVGGTAVGIYYESNYIVFASWAIIALFLATAVVSKLGEKKQEEQQ